MDKTKTRIILLLLGVLLLGGSYFGVLLAEQRKRLTARSGTQSDIQASLIDAEQSRQEYFIAVEARKAELRKEMEKAKAEYEELLEKQPALVDANKKSVSVPVTRMVETQVPETSVTTSRPKSTRKTKTS